MALPLTHRLRPKTLNEIILVDRIKKLIPEDGNPKQSMLFSGHAGIGKTTLAKILVSGHPVLFLNGSTNALINTVRTDITAFCSQTSLEYDTSIPKIVYIDEFDGASNAFYDALRETMDRWSDVLFIATCNYINKIPDPIISRFQLIEFDPKTQKENEELELLYMKRTKLLSNKLKIKWESTQVLKAFIKQNIPDMRRIISKLQLFRDSNVKMITMAEVKNTQYVFNDLFKVLLNKNTTSVDIYKKSLSEYYSKIDEVFTALGLEFPNYVIEHINDPNVLTELVPTIGQWAAMSKKITDPVLALNGCLVVVNSIMKKYQK